MMRLIALTLSLTMFASVALALDITTNDGTTYKRCEVTKVEPDALVISYSDGIARLPFESLSPSLQKQYHFDSTKAAEYRKRIADAKAAAAKKASDEAAQRRATALRAQQEQDAQIAQQRDAEQPQTSTPAQKAPSNTEVSEETKQTAIHAGVIVIIFLVILGFVTYFLPTIIAFNRGKQNTLAIFMLNLFLGWSLVGWVIALVWACTTDA